LALLSLMSDEGDQALALENARFRQMLVAMHPDRAKEILEILDGAQPLADGEIPEWAPEMSEEEMDEYQPFSVEEAQAATDLLRRFGVAVVD
jgi:hypothetical protein